MKKTFTTLLALGGVLFGVQTFAQAELSLSTSDGCAPLTVTVTNLTDVGNNATCSFAVSDGTNLSGCQSSFDVTFFTPGEYTITYTYTPDGGSSSTYTSEIITVFEPADAPVLVADGDNGLAICTNCVTADNIQTIWIVDGAQQGVDVESVTLDFGVLYEVTVTSVHGCIATTTATFTGIEDIAAAKLNLFPNPANQEFRVISSDVSDWYEIRDAVGRVVETGPTRTREFTVNVSSLVNGVYTLALKNDGKVQSSRFIVMH